MKGPAAATPRIHRLSDEIANKIAAGEVVERPASVVKELVENAIDAGAGRIEVRLEAGGRDLVEVVDDGGGMGFEDARLCLERHATSKLRTADDLFAIRTLGFRGEALPSIAAVSRLEILTRPADAVAGTRVRVVGGRVEAHEAAGAPAGTTLRVADLFFNVPARRKFLRRPETELGHASETLVRIALAHPDVGFRLVHGGRVLLDSPAGGGLGERVTAALGKDVGPHLHPVSGGAGEIGITGVLAAPSVTRTSNRGIYLFVNRRFVRDRSLNHAVVRAYGDLVDRGRSPVVVLFVDVAPDAVDVNVHPQKIEVRFADGRRVYEAVASAVARTLRAAPWVGGEGRRYALEATGSEGAGDPARASEAAAPGGFEDHRARVLGALERFGARRGAATPGPFTSGGRAMAAALPFEGPSPGTDYFGRLEVLGQLKASYILCEGPEGLVVIDQHAAHERLAFERLRKAWAEREVAVQRLLVPRTLSLPTGQAEQVEEHLEVLAAAGFDLSSLGGGTVALRSVPAALAEADVVRVLGDFLDELAGLGESASFERAMDRILATVACHSVVRFGQALSKAECEALLAQLDPIDLKGNCPHGRPVAFALPVPEIERRFGRR
jgi:DNA mismatch repair protein MutL